MSGTSQNSRFRPGTVKRAGLYLAYALGLYVFVVLPVVNIVHLVTGGHENSIWYVVTVGVALALRTIMLRRAYRTHQQVGHHAIWIAACFLDISVNGVYLPIIQFLIIGYTVAQLGFALGQRSRIDRSRTAG